MVRQIPAYLHPWLRPCRLHVHIVYKSKWILNRSHNKLQSQTALPLKTKAVHLSGGHVILLYHAEI